MIIDLKDEMGFWKSVHLKFEKCSFSDIICIRDAVVNNFEQKATLSKYLDQKVSITSDLDVVRRLDTLSSQCKFAFATLYCLLQIPPPSSFFQDDELKLLISSYLTPPNISFRAQNNNITLPDNDKPLFSGLRSKPMTNEFFDELDSALHDFPDIAGEILRDNLKVDSLKDFVNTANLFFQNERTIVSITMFVRHFIHPFIASLDSNPHRQVINIILNIFQSYPTVIIDELIIPLFFNNESRACHHMLIQQIVSSEKYSYFGIHLLFKNRIPSLIPPISGFAIKTLCNIIPKTHVEDLNNLKLILYFIKSQLESGQEEIQRVFLILLKTEGGFDEECFEIFNLILDKMKGHFRAPAQKLISNIKDNR